MLHEGRKHIHVKNFKKLSWGGGMGGGSVWCINSSDFDIVAGEFWDSFFVTKEFRDEVIGKNQIYLERNTLHRQSVGHLGRQEALKYGVVSFYKLGNFIC